jgi:hypothetical protein
MRGILEIPNSDLLREDDPNISSHAATKLNQRLRLHIDRYICELQLDWHPVAVIQYIFTHKQYTEQQN